MIKNTKRFVGEKNSQKIFISSEYHYIGVRCCEDGLIFQAFKEPVGDWLCRPVDSSSRAMIPRVAVENYDLNGYVDTIVDTEAETVIIKRKGIPFVITDYTKVAVPHIDTKNMKNVSVETALNTWRSLAHGTCRSTYKIGYCNKKDKVFMTVQRVKKSEVEDLPTYNDLASYYSWNLAHFEGYVEFTSTEIRKLFIGKNTKNVAMSVKDGLVVISPEITQCDFNEEHTIVPAQQKAQTKVLCSDCAKEENEISKGIAEIEKLLEKADRLVRMVEALKRENDVLKEQISVLGAE